MTVTSAFGLPLWTVSLAVGLLIASFFETVVGEGKETHTGMMTRYKYHHGSCSQQFIPRGYQTVAMNSVDFRNGEACGGCIRVCFTDPNNCYRNKSGQCKRCFKAIVNNHGPTPKGCLDWAFHDRAKEYPNGGKWPMRWKYIRCPRNKWHVTAGKSNQYWGQIKFQNKGRMTNVTCNNVAWKKSPLGWFEHPRTAADGRGNLGCGLQCRVTTRNPVITKYKNLCVSGKLFSDVCPKQRVCIPNV